MSKNDLRHCNYAAWDLLMEIIAECVIAGLEKVQGTYTHMPSTHSHIYTGKYNIWEL